MSEWIKYSERKPEKSGRYLVIHDSKNPFVDISVYYRQADIDIHNEISAQVDELYDRFHETEDDKEQAIIRKKIDELYKENPFYLIDEEHIRDEGFYDWWDEGDGFGHYEYANFEYWMSLPEPPINEKEEEND